MINSLRKSARHWAECTMSMWTKFTFMMQHLCQRIISLYDLSENQANLTW